MCFGVLVDGCVGFGMKGGPMEYHYAEPGVVARVVDASQTAPPPAVIAPPRPGRIAVYDGLSAPPMVEEVRGDNPRDLIEGLASRTYQLSHEAGGVVPYSVIREVVENFIHAGFDEVVVSVLDGGARLVFADQGPGIKDKERAFQPGFTTASHDMKRVIKGVGSGLPVAREGLTFSGGTITIEDNLGAGTVVTIAMTAPASSRTAEPMQADDPPAATDYSPPSLTTRQKQVLSLAMELGSVGPTAVSRELKVALSTAYRDLEYLAHSGLLHTDETGKRLLTDDGVRCLDALFGR